MLGILLFYELIIMYKNVEMNNIIMVHIIEYQHCCIHIPNSIPQSIYMLHSPQRTIILFEGTSHCKL